MLKICALIFEEMNKRNIRYCHWKSNSHLEQALDGKTDLDLLVYRQDKNEILKILSKYNIKEMISPIDKQFPGIEDYLGYDNHAGKFIHLHLHYDLVLGQKYIKNHHLPLEKIVFDNLIEKNKVKIPCPEFELILLIIRAHLKVDILSLLKHLVKDLIGDSYTPFPYGIEEELQQLIKKNEKNKMLLILRQMKIRVNEESFLSFISRFENKKLRCYHVAIFSLIILFSLRDYRRNKNIFINFKYILLVIKNNRFVQKVIKPKKKNMVKGGIIISFVGADGSGKSSITKDLQDWLSWKLNVSKYYYGIPKTIFFKSLDLFIRILSKARIKYLKNIVLLIYWVIIARYRYRVSEEAKKDCRKKYIVITDRFPLKRFRKMTNAMDGPRLKEDNGVIEAFFSRIEMYYYDRIEDPNLIFVLKVDKGELRRRKSDTEFIEHMVKADAVNGIQGNGIINIVDANKSYSQVLKEIKGEIWANV